MLYTLDILTCLIKWYKFKFQRFTPSGCKSLSLWQRLNSFNIFFNSIHTKFLYFFLKKGKRYFLSYWLKLFSNHLVLCKKKNIQDFNNLFSIFKEMSCRTKPSISDSSFSQAQKGYIKKAKSWIPINWIKQDNWIKKEKKTRYCYRDKLLISFT